MTLTEAVTADVVTTGRDASVRDSLQMMDEQHVGSVVVTEDDEPIGIVTDRMIAMALREMDTLDDLTVGDVMTEDLITINEDATHFDALQTMSENGFRRLPIVDENGRLTGIVTLDDMLIISAAELSNVSDVIEQQAGPL